MAPRVAAALAKLPNTTNPAACDMPRENKAALTRKGERKRSGEG